MREEIDTKGLIENGVVEECLFLNERKEQI
jgi:hypothetical protein